MIKHWYKDIPGWMNYEQVFDLIIEQSKDGDTIVETGTWFGASACYFGVAAFNSGKKLKFITIDIDKQYQEYAEFPGALISRSEKIRENIKPLKNVTYIEGDSLELSTTFKDNSLRAVFLDADHTYPFVKKEISLWFPKVMKGGVLSGHDVDWPGVKQAVDEFCVENKLTYQIINTSWVIQL